MRHRINQLFTLGFILLIAVMACRLGRQAPPPAPPPTFTREPSPTPFPLPPEPTATVPVEPTPTNTRVIIPTDTPEFPPTDTPTPEPPPADTPASEPSPTEPPPPAETEPPPEPVGNGTKIDWDDADGQPNVFPGQDEGYFVWTDGDRVRIRVLTDGSRQVFSGRAVGNGAIVRVDRFAQEGIDVTIREGVNQIDFQWGTAGGPDGLDFTFTGNILQLNLRIDNKSEPELVFVGEDKLTLTNGLPLQLVR